MDPNQNYTPPPTNYSIDYLDQIAPQQASRGPSPKVMIAAIVAGVIALVVFGMMIFGGGASNTDKWTQLYLRVSTIESIVSKTQTDLKDSALRGANSKLALYLADAKNDIKEIAIKSGMKTDKIPDKLKSNESKYKQALTTKLEDAKVKVILDRTYAREMAYQIDVISALMQQNYKLAGPKTKANLEEIHANITAVAKQFSDFDDTK